MTKTVQSFISMLLLLFCAPISKAQETEPVIAQVYYQFVHVNDTTKRDKPHKEEMVLYIGTHQSFYTSNINAFMQKQMREQMSNPAFDGKIIISGKGAGSNESFYFLPKSRILKKTYRLAKQQYIVDEPYPELNWKISTDTMTIGGYLCQKAITQFKGRAYHAWFAPELPFSFGPWKLQGLPGLILEAYDNEEEVVFRYAGFDKLGDGKVQIGAIGDYIKTDQKSLEKLIAAAQKNRKVFMDAQGDGGVSRTASVVTGIKKEELPSFMDASRIRSIEVRKDEGGVSSTNNNPLERSN